jgi:hypothetical protein
VLLDPIPSWLVMFGSFFAMALLMLGGFYLGRRSQPLSGHTTSALTTLKTAIFALVGLLLAFSFSLAGSRYDARKRLVIDEANATRTAYLRGALLPEQVRPHYQEGLSRYLTARLDFFRAGRDDVKIADANRRVAVLQRDLWALSTAEANRKPDSQTLTLVVQSLNQLFDVTSTRNVVRLDEVPTEILLLLLAAVLIAAFLWGHTLGVEKRGHILTSLAFLILLTFILSSVFDLDRPRRGFILESQRAMENLARSLDGAD